MRTISPSSRLTLWLSAGMLAGLALALFGLLRGAGDSETLAPQVAARVAGQSIDRDAYTRALNAVAADRRTPLDADGRREVLDRLVNEALLIQYGLDLDLLRQSPRLRDQLVDTVLSSLRAEADAQSYDDAAVQAFYTQNAALFRGPDLFRVATIRTQAKPAAMAARNALDTGRAFAEVQAQYASEAVIVPNTALPADKLRDYLGPELMHAVELMSAGDNAGPIASNNGYAVLHLYSRTRARQPPLDKVADAVRLQVRRRAAESLLRERLAELRQQYAVTIADDLR